MSRRLLGSERVGDVIHRYWSHDGNITVESVQDVEPILEANKRKYNDAPSTWKGDVHSIANIPGVLINRLCYDKAKEWGCNAVDVFRELCQGSDRANKVLNEMLNSREFMYLRTRPGRVDLKG